jgi:2-keto-4-pentenoate hydratase/2-oxohepta-3-ene-1,7-dioic acid hydratase in catechol pathway
VKLATLVIDGQSKPALVSPDTTRFWLLEELLGKPVRDMIELIRSFESSREQIVPTGNGRILAGVAVATPIVPTRNVMCVGKNYHAHAYEFTRSGFDSSAKGYEDAIPAAPIFFTKPPETIIGSGETIRYPTDLSDSIDYEAELGVVIGTAGRAIKREDALKHVFGYTIINDITARDLQARHKQWFIGKSLDTFCPMGPWIVTASDVDVGNLDVKCWVNNELRQNANTAELIFDVPSLIETLSAGLTLLPGDVIATGTPAGVGIGFDPPKYLSRGDEIVIEISGLGRLVNRLE